MEAFVTARRTKDGQEDAFRRQWRTGEQPEGMIDAYLLEADEDPRETLSLSFWDSAEQLLAYRASDAAKQRDRQLRGLVAKTRWQRPFVAFSAADIEAGGRKLPLLLPLLLVAAGVGVFLFLKRRGQGQAEEPASEQALAAPSEVPAAGVAPMPGTASGTASGQPTPSTGAPLV